MFHPSAFRRFWPIALIALIIIFITSLFHTAYFPIDLYSIAFTPLTFPAPFVKLPQSNLSVTAIIEAYDACRLAALGEWNTEQATAYFKSRATPMSPSTELYVNRLRTFVHEYFDGTAIGPNLHNAIDRVENRLPPARDVIPKVVWSTCKGGKDATPPDFSRWEKRLGPWGWSVKVAGDEEMQEVFEELTLGSQKWEGLWSALPKPVLKSDIFRYLALLYGGIYTDSDTVPRANPFLWGSNAEDITPKALKALQPLLELELDDQECSGSHSDTVDLDEMYRGGIAEPDVSLVVAMEEPDRPWAPMQMVQYSFMTKPFHPVFIDVLEIVVRNVEWCIENNALDGSMGILQMTGPKPFTEAIYRHLLVQYGIPYDRTFGKEKNLRIGDTLFVALGGFGRVEQGRKAARPGDDEWDFNSPYDPRDFPVHHDYYGRWIEPGWGVTK